MTSLLCFFTTPPFSSPLSSAPPFSLKLRELNMVSDDSYVSVPSYFRCPISLDVMKSPVSLCTGVTYDRSSIQRWLDAGNNTCPATMQLLHNKDLIPNYTLQRLINIWVDSVPTRSLTPDHATQLVHQLGIQLRSIEKHKHSFICSISRLTSFAAESGENGRDLAAAGRRILPLLVSIVGKMRDLSLLERIILFINVLMEGADETVVMDHEIEIGEIKSSIVMCLNQGKLELRIAVAKFVNLISTKLRLGLNSSSISEDEEIYSEILKLITTCDWKSEAIDACLSFLTSSNRNRSKLVRGGGVKTLAAALTAAEMSAASTEKALKLLELMSGCKEGRKEICGSEICVVEAVVKKMLKVSTAATERAVAVLWSLCCLFGENRVAAAVARSNGVGKILMVLQSNCSPKVRQMCADLLRLFRCSSNTSWYDTKTTHIVPF